MLVALVALAVIACSKREQASAGATASATATASASASATATATASASATATASASASASASATDESCGTGRVWGDGGCVRRPGWAPAEIVMTTSFGCVRYGSGEVRCRGDWVPPGDDAVHQAAQLVVGQSHACVRRATGILECWGLNDVGQLGRGHLDGEGQVKPPPQTPSPVVGIEDATMLAAGWSHTCAIRRSGKVACWGWNRGHAVGKGPDVPVASPQEVPGVSGAAVLGLGIDWSCAGLRDGRLLCWGALGDKDGGPRVVPGIQGVEQMVMTRSFADPWACVRTSGAVKCFGTNASRDHTPVAIPGITDAKMLAASIRRVCAARAKGPPSCWVASTTDTKPFGDATAKAIAMGTDIACILKSDDTIACAHENGADPEGSRLLDVAHL